MKPEFIAAKRYARLIPKMRNKRTAVLRLCEKLKAAIAA